MRLCLTSAKLPSSAPLPIEAPARRWAKGPMRTSSSTSQDSRTLAMTRQRSPTTASTEPTPGADEALRADAAVAAKEDVGLQDDVLAELDVGIDERGRRVLHGHARQQMALQDPPPEIGLEGRQLDAIVDPRQLHLVLDLDWDDPAAVGMRQRDELGQVQLTGRRRGLQVADPGPQPGALERIQAAVDLLDGALSLGRVLVLDDPGDVAAGPDDPAVAPRVLRHRGGQGDGRFGRPAAFDEAAHGRGRQERRVAAQDDDLVRRTLHGRHGRLEGVPGAERRILDRPVHIVGEDAPDGLGGRRDEDQGASSGGLDRRLDDVGQHRTSAQRMEDLGASRAHPGPEPGRQDDDGRRGWMSRHRAAIPVRAWAGVGGHQVAEIFD